MTRSQMIDEIMTLVGVDPRDFAAARANYETLHDEEIVSRLKRMHGRADRVRAWRFRRTPLAPRPADAARRKLDEISSRLGLPPLAAREEHELFVQAQKNHPALVPIARPVLTHAGTVDAIARVQNTISRHKPDLIVKANQSGASIAEIVVTDLNLDIPAVAFHGDYETEVEISDPSRPVENVQSIWIFGHVAVSGRVLQRAVTLARAKFGAKNICVAVLAATGRALRFLDVPVVYHQYADAVDIEIVFDPSKPMEARDGFFVLIGRGGRGEICLSSADLKIARTDLRPIEDDLSLRLSVPLERQPIDFE